VSGSTYGYYVQGQKNHKKTFTYGPDNDLTEKMEQVKEWIKSPQVKSDTVFTREPTIDTSDPGDSCREGRGGARHVAKIVKVCDLNLVT
jgi:hypothetical protein